MNHRDSPSHWEILDIDGLEREAAQRPVAELLATAARLRDAGHGNVVSYSRKVFIPLTELCRDVCHYCTYAKTPRRLKSAYLHPEQVLAIARAGRDAGCREALFTLGDKPELRYTVARRALAELGTKPPCPTSPPWRNWCAGKPDCCPI